MRPPICAVCDEHFNPFDGALISFKMTEKDNELAKKLEQPGFVGHPPATEWFCSFHFERAQQLIHLTLHEAMEILKAELIQKDGQ